MATDDAQGTSITGAGLAEARRLATELARREEEQLMSTGSLGGDPFASIAAAAEAAVAVAIEAGASVDDVHRVILPDVGALARQRAAGRLMVDAASLAFVEDNLMVRSEGEVPVGRVSRLRQILTAARREFDASVRRAVIGGMSAQEIVTVAADAGIELATLDIVLALQGAGST
jgi:hypothetical protein